MKKISQWNEKIFKNLKNEVNKDSKEIWIKVKFVDLIMRNSDKKIHVYCFQCY